MANLSTLQPNSLWKHFEDICTIPHPSKHEEQIIEHLINFAKKHNLEYKQDSIGNVLIKKNATKGFENREILALQAHVDMVPQKNTSTQHNFITDPILSYIIGNLVKAQNTTLGADNGIGLAAILAILESKTLQHGSLEALFTRDEETGMTGANQLDKTLLKAKYLINTDTENANEITVGCAGGLDANFIFDISKTQTPVYSIAYSISISGLSGGHSGFEIHLGRANANILITEFLSITTLKFHALISQIHGGNMRNAIPREAQVTLVIPDHKKEEFLHYIELFVQEKKAVYSITDPNFSCIVLECNIPEQVIEKPCMEAILQALKNCPNGVISYENESKGIVKTSTNLSIISKISVKRRSQYLAHIESAT
jgi:dipeptidase D